MKYNLQILKNNKIFEETQISFPKWIEHQIFLDPQLQPLGCLDITKLSDPLTSKSQNISHIKKTVFRIFQIQDH